jgi:plastocyanin
MKKVAFLVLALTLVLTACGGKSGKVTLNVTSTDTGYDSKVYTIPAGTEVTLKMTNNGAVEHEFAILKLGEHVSLPFSDDDEAKIFWELDGVAAGETKSGTFTAPTEPGEYDIVCGLPGHIEQGNVATLIVK